MTFIMDAARPTGYTPRARGTMRIQKRLAIVLCATALLAGCVSPATIERAGIQYDRAVMNVIIQQLLLNVARYRHHHPVHFTAVSNVAATFDFRANAGLTPALSGTDGKTLLPIFGGTIAENPTISIVPIEGEEFTKRMLTPMDENKFLFLIRQGVPASVLLRLMVREFASESMLEGEEVFTNTPSKPAEYKEFRRRVLHLESLSQSHKLFVEPLAFEKAWELPLRSPQAFEALEKGYQVSYDDKNQIYLLRKQIHGRVVITNYDPAILSNEVRYHLHLEALRAPADQVLVDIRPGYPGGDYPFHGRLRLRSFNAILGFLARGIAEEPEFSVEKDPRSGAVRFNPDKTLEILETDAALSDAAFSVSYNGRHYSIRGQDQADPIPSRWNLGSFRVLYQLFQMTVTDVSKTLVPAITIAK